MTRTTFKLPVLNLLGKKTGDFELPKEIFGGKINPPLMAQAVRVYLSNQRKAFAKTKTRSEVSGSGRKIWRQKGTGRARHGDRYAPIFVGGGRAHGPKGNQNYELKMPKKMKKAALYSALASKFKAERIILVKNWSAIEPKTKKTQEIMINLLKKNWSRKKKYLVVFPKKIKEAKRGFQNLPFVDLLLANSLNAYQVLNHDWLIFDLDSIKKMIQEEKNG